MMINKLFKTTTSRALIWLYICVIVVVHGFVGYQWIANNQYPEGVEFSLLKLTLPLFMVFAIASLKQKNTNDNE